MRPIALLAAALAAPVPGDEVDGAGERVGSEQRCGAAQQLDALDKAIDHAAQAR